MMKCSNCLDYEAASIGKYLPTFRRAMSAPS